MSVHLHIGVYTVIALAVIGIAAGIFSIVRKIQASRALARERREDNWKYGPGMNGDDGEHGHYSPPRVAVRAQTMHRRELEREWLEARDEFKLSKIAQSGLPGDATPAKRQSVRQAYGMAQLKYRELEKQFRAFGGVPEDYS